MQPGKTCLGISPNGSGPVGVILVGHTDSGEEITVGAYGADVFSASDEAKAFVEHERWDFTFVADDYQIRRWPESLVLVTDGESTSLEHKYDG